MQVVVVVSPAKARTIRKVLGRDYRVIACYGHVRDLPAKAGSVRPHDGFAMVYEDTTRLEQAITAHRAALEVFTRERAPDDWAFEQDHLGNALSTLGERKNSTALLEQALDAHRAALKVLTRDRVSLSWATTQTNLGITLMILGQREKGMARIEQSVDAYRVALLERTRERTPLDWPQTQINLGKALYLLGERDHNRKFFEEARNAYRATLELLESAGAPRLREMAQNDLKEVARKLLESGPSASVAQ